MFRQIALFAQKLKIVARRTCRTATDTAYLLIPVGIVAVLCLALWQYPPTHDFGLNAFTETLGIILTVLVVDQLIRQQERRRSLPLEAAGYEDVRLLITRVVYFWHTAFERSVPTATPTTVRELFSAESIDAIRAHLDLDSRPNVAPARTWWSYLPEQEAEFHHLAERILERHAATLDPFAYARVHRLATGLFAPGAGLRIIPAIRASDSETHFPRPHRLGDYWGTLEGRFTPVVELYDWCIHKKTELEQFGIVDLLSVPSALQQREAIPNPPCMIAVDELRRQQSAMEEFRRTHDSA